MSWGTDEIAAPATDTWGSAAVADDTPTDNAEGTAEGEAPTTPAPAVGELSKEKYVSKARDAGWNEATAIDFSKYQNGGAEDNDWHGAAASYEWKDEYGDVGPEVLQLEMILFGGEFQMKRGERMEPLELKVNIEGPVLIKPIKSFDEAGLHPIIQSNVEKCGYDKPTPIQAYAIPAVLQAMDVVGVAQTGSGKTAAYLIPVLSRLMGKAKKLAAPKPNTADPSYNPQFHKVKAEPLVVVVVPTRELAIQIFDEARRLCYRSMLRPCVAYGGLPMKICVEELGKGCDILIASPGRLCDLMDKPHVLTMSRVKYTIIDEADEMLDADWESELSKIMAGGGKYI
ncbi:hypothetical protein LTR78_005767 [Recurvomyces mirabilis]|uniref:RNA helicase n=1 Tax=Recurvomyces mirabilis TaxID=574656 RepID=A0AAE0WMB2_9PEZI|nr:hypothetical protein LTR78_005767 [Recurvomyces mirabilis]KAK5154146.1 hypothetical protein LTS14_006831 [Recurvomyces mirabilis]